MGSFSYFYKVLACWQDLLGNVLWDLYSVHRLFMVFCSVQPTLAGRGGCYCHGASLLSKAV